MGDKSLVAPDGRPNLSGLKFFRVSFASGLLHHCGCGAHEPLLIAYCGVYPLYYQLAIGVFMADIQEAIYSVLRQEDATLSGVITDIPGDSGGRTRYGIAERWHPELTATGFFSTMSSAAALKVAEGVYAASYAKHLMLAQISRVGRGEVSEVTAGFGIGAPCSFGLGIR
jgi:Glycosyl hydrolase 108